MITTKFHVSHVRGDDKFCGAVHRAAPGEFIARWDTTSRLTESSARLSVDPTPPPAPVPVDGWFDHHMGEVAWSSESPASPNVEAIIRRPFGEGEWLLEIYVVAGDRDFVMVTPVLSGARFCQVEWVGEVIAAFDLDWVEPAPAPERRGVCSL